MLNRDLRDIIILDNSPVSYAMNQSNGVPISSWFDDRTDCELMNMTPLLEFLAIVPDVREFIPKLIVNNEIAYAQAREVINSYKKGLNAIPIEAKEEPLEVQIMNKRKHKTVKNKMHLLPLNNNANKSNKKKSKVLFKLTKKSLLASAMTKTFALPTSILNSKHDPPSNDLLSLNRGHIFSSKESTFTSTAKDDPLQTESNTANHSQRIKDSIKHKKVQSFALPSAIDTFRRRRTQNNPISIKDKEVNQCETQSQPSIKAEANSKPLRWRNVHVFIDSNLQPYLTQDQSKPKEMNPMRKKKQSRDLVLTNTVASRVFLKEEKGKQPLKSKCNNKKGSVPYDIEQSFRSTSRPAPHITTEWMRSKLS